MKNDVKTRQRGNLAQYQSVANVLKVRMITIGMKQNELSEKLGISQSRVSNYLNGKSEPDFYTLSKMAEHLRISLNDLILNSGTLLAGAVGGRADANLYNTQPNRDDDDNDNDSSNELNHPSESYKPFIMAKKLTVRGSVANTKSFVSLPPQVVKMINPDENMVKNGSDEQVIILEITETIYSSKVVLNNGDLVFAVSYTSGMDVGDDALLIKPGKNFSVVKLSKTLNEDGEHRYTVLQEHLNQSREVPVALGTSNLEGFFLVTAVLQVM